MNITIRYYQENDYRLLIKLLEKEYGSQIDQATLEKEYVSNKRSIIIAVSDEDLLVGCTFLEIQEDFVRPSKVLYVTYVAVDENYRKHGIGRKLFERVENIAQENTCSSIELTSADFRTGAHAFYNSLGFTKKKTTLFIKEI